VTGFHASRSTHHFLKILILKPSSLGDVIQALPVLRLLKLHFATRKFSGGLIPRSRRCCEGDPDLAGVVRFERKRWARRTLAGNVPQHPLAARAKLRSRH
jgi:ADP-heptose:LPS heptosyltransferase